jgi:hypothetical protein
MASPERDKPRSLRQDMEQTPKGEKFVTAKPVLQRHVISIGAIVLPLHNVQNLGPLQPKMTL